MRLRIDLSTDGVSAKSAVIGLEYLKRLCPSAADAAEEMLADFYTDISASDSSYGFIGYQIEG
jgi:hypothetical protein